ncbi:MAG: glycosyltransferase family 39 protein [Leptolyngbyaceae cyanobacterium SL_7_1]|nr:glycosyltransferase family 39 protein [Leptolyngbyaceae cyanobacterium SL_7_1]
MASVMFPILITMRQWLKTDRAIDWLWSGGLFAAALLLCWINLGDLPLRDWDEGTVAAVAREIWRSPLDSQTWLYPTLWGKPYFNKPTLVHTLIVAAYEMAGVNEWTSRLPGATLTACSVPLLYSVGRELFRRRASAVFAALVYLTSLPIVRHGRLAMLDGALICFVLGMMLCVLRSRRDSRYALGVGIGLSLVCLTKGGLVGVLFSAIAIAFLWWDTPRLLISPPMWIGVIIGGLPIGAWYVAQWKYYGAVFLSTNLVDQSLRRVWQPVESNTAPPWFYLVELLKYGFPWLLFLPQGVHHAWENRNLSWAKFALVWSGMYFLTISAMMTKLPWYVLPIYPALALLVGAQLTVLWDKGNHVGVKHTPEPYAPSWIGVFVGLAAIAGAGSLYFTLSAHRDLELQIILAIVALTSVAVARLIALQNPRFLTVLIWGCYLALLGLMVSSHWVWELAESYPVKPVAQMVQRSVPVGQPVFTTDPIERPSLNFYSDRRVIPASTQRMQRQWQRKQNPYFLLDNKTLSNFELQPIKIIDTAQGWTLVTRSDLLDSDPALPRTLTMLVDPPTGF